MERALDELKLDGVCIPTNVDGESLDEAPVGGIDPENDGALVVVGEQSAFAAQGEPGDFP